MEHPLLIIILQSHHPIWVDSDHSGKGNKLRFPLVAPENPTQEKREGESFAIAFSQLHNTAD